MHAHIRQPFWRQACGNNPDDLSSHVLYVFEDNALQAVRVHRLKGLLSTAPFFFFLAALLGLRPSPSQRQLSLASHS